MLIKIDDGDCNVEVFGDRVVLRTDQRHLNEDGEWMKGEIVIEYPEMDKLIEYYQKNRSL